MYNGMDMSLSSIKIKIYVVLFTLARTVINTSYRMVFPFLPVFARELGVEPATLGRTLSIRSFLGVFGPFLATLADTHDRKTGILLGLGLFTAGSGIVGIWPTFWAFVLGTSLVLLGNVVFIPSLGAFLGDNVPYKRRGRVLAITELSWSLAFILGIPFVRFLIDSYSWVTPFFIIAGIGLLFFILFAVLLPANPIAGTQENTIWQNLGRILKSWPALAGLLAGVSFTSANETVNLIFGVWIDDQFGLNLTALTIASVVIGVSELGGELFSALWLDVLGKKRVIWIFLGLNSLAALLLPITSGLLSWAIVGLGFFYITFEVVLVSSLTLMSEVVPTARATMVAATVAGFSLGRMLGDLTAPGLYEVSFLLCCLVTVVLNLLAGGLLTQVRVE